MPALIKPGSVKVITQEGEVQVSITLELNINLNSDGVVAAAVISEKEKVIEKKKEDSIWEIPDFESSTINFGKRE